MSKVTLLATGDSIITRRVSTHQDQAFTELVQLVRNTDVSFTNLEIMTPEEPKIPSSEFGGMPLSAPPFILDELKWFGFNLYNVANNHATDYTFQGLCDTLLALQNREMIFAGGGYSMGEARSPGYLETKGCRVGLIGAASTYVTGALAAARRTDSEGRPGINPLRFDTEFMLDSDRMQQLEEIDRVMGTKQVTERHKEFGLMPEKNPDAHKFLDRDFVCSDEPGVRTSPNERDVEEITKWIKDARRQADLVVVTLHAHEGPNCDSNNDQPAEFIKEAARQFIDAGADIFIGHGPHLLRAMEMYKGKPIFYSVGNFMFMFETVETLPSEMYEQQQMDPDCTPADVHDDWSEDEDGNPIAFHDDPRFWQSVVPVCTFDDGAVSSIKLHPVTLNLQAPRSIRGLPQMAGQQEGQEILQTLSELSEPYGTEIDIDSEGGRSVGRVILNDEK